MRRRVKEGAGPGAPPLTLTRYRGTTNREALAWIRDREEWWQATHGPDAIGDLQWLFDGLEQIGTLHFCGSVGTPCGDLDCLCLIEPDEYDPQHQTPGAPRSATNRKEAHAVLT